MRIQDMIFFSPDRALETMEGASFGEWGEAWRQRVESYYLTPLRQLIESGEGFASLVMLSTAIEAVGTIKHRRFPEPGKRFKKTARDLLPDQSMEMPEVLYKHYRNGLVHNGRTNQTRAGRYHQNNEFSVIDFDLDVGFRNETPHRVVVKLYSINPQILTNLFIESFNNWVNRERDALGGVVSQEFVGDLEYLRILRAG